MYLNWLIHFLNHWAPALCSCVTILTIFGLLPAASGHGPNVNVIGDGLIPASWGSDAGFSGVSSGAFKLPEGRLSAFEGFDKSEKFNSPVLYGGGHHFPSHKSFDDNVLHKGATDFHQDMYSPYYNEQYLSSSTTTVTPASQKTDTYGQNVPNKNYYYPYPFCKDCFTSTYPSDGNQNTTTTSTTSEPSSTTTADDNSTGKKWLSDRPFRAFLKKVRGRPKPFQNRKRKFRLMTYS